MKTSTKTLVSFAMVLSWGTLALSAQSCAATSNISAAAGHSAAASKEMVKAAGHSGAASVKVVSGVVAVPVFVSGAAIATTGSIVSAVGESAAAAGKTTTEVAEKLWDSSTRDPAKRPPLDRDHAVPPAKKITAAKPLDPAPGAMLKAKQ
jgi:hypothetical protein